jgi:hypothetical protein
MAQPRTALAEEIAVAPELPLLRRYVGSVKAGAVYARCRLNPLYSHRLGLLREYAPCWATDAGGEDRIRFDRLGGDRSWLLSDIDAATKSRYVAVIKKDYIDDLQRFHIEPIPDRALRDCLDLARREGIECALLVTPESDEYRSWYSPDALACFARYCAAISQEYGVPVCDGSAWIPDEQFSDGTHLLRAGAEQFSQRLGREVLAPLVEGRFRTSLSAR